MNSTDKFNIDVVQTKKLFSVKYIDAMDKFNKMIWCDTSKKNVFPSQKIRGSIELNGIYKWYIFKE